LAETPDPVGELVSVIAALREHCPWMGALTHESLVEYLLEEAYEVAETIETGADEAELKGELGDVLLQVVLHSRLAEERGVFSFSDVARGLTGKMIRRNPHVFRPDGSLQDSFPATVEEIVLKWDAVKKAESPQRRTPFEGIPVALPALAQAQKTLDRAERAGLPLEGPTTARFPGRACEVRGAVGEVELAAAMETEAELGELLLAVVRSARSRGFDAERALRGAVRRYQDRHPETSRPGS
jgi:MazG family protein